MAETWKSRFLRWRINWFPAYRRTGARVVYLAPDHTEMRIALPLGRATRNLNGTLYGGAIYAAVDPLHALLVSAQLGRRHQVWVRAARISFRRQGRSTLYATARVEPAEVAELRAELEETGRAERDFRLDLQDASGEVCAHCVVTVHVRSRVPAVPQAA
ncbi:DUF4442 domain-containing protein [Opitutus sp. ER46]|uniref:DUF4442 domain-containing protein n=1 Tax=Opitutus sp. ER46 TaxID=2161864 RepID=UPI000D30AE09|nr:DUF4442 domain-containing protein [Opitutus sp. ER46]PTX91215.1 DUF4442 domain-containing protein [Opitutus sp. ER46]